jgi:hypothetical protein
VPRPAPRCRGVLAQIPRVPWTERTEGQGAMVNVALPPSSIVKIGSDHRAARDVKNAEGTRKPPESCESAPAAPPGVPGAPHAGDSSGPYARRPQLARASAGRNTKGTQEPQESRRMRAMAGQPGARRPQRKNPS